MAGAGQGWVRIRQVIHDTDTSCVYFNSHDCDLCLRAKVVIYDLEKDVRFTVTQNWDRSPDSLSVSSSVLFICVVIYIEHIPVFA